MRTIELSKQFKRDYKLMIKRGYDIRRLERVIALLRYDAPLPKEYRDHALSGIYAGLRECHIAADWLLVYKIKDNRLILALHRTGTHSDLF